MCVKNSLLLPNFFVSRFFFFKRRIKLREIYKNKNVYVQYEKVKKKGSFFLFTNFGSEKKKIVKSNREQKGHLIF